MADRIDPPGEADFTELTQVSLRAARQAAGGDEGMAEDAAQEAVLRYLSSDGVIDPAAWCARVARNCVRDRIRVDKGVRRQQRVSRWASLGDQQAARAMVEDVHRMRSPSEQVAARSVLAEAMATLDELSREALLLTVLDGLPADEVGERLGLSRDAVYQRVRRAKAVLASELAPLDDAAS